MAREATQQDYKDFYKSLTPEQLKIVKQADELWCDFFEKDMTLKEMEHKIKVAKYLAIKKVIAHQLKMEMKAQNINKTQMAKLMNTSRATVNRLLEPNNYSLTLHTLSDAALALGKSLSVRLD